MAQTILVTGSTSGFGRLTVETLARQGYRVFAGMRAVAEKNAPAAEELRVLAQREQLALQIVEIDVTDDASVERAIAHVIAQPAGERPLRTVVATVAQRQAPQALNDAATQAMHSFLEALNIPGAALALQGEQERKQR
jgi:NAD(P)-dependent dehydrogenase (short-subunit alcohol dehydrogenase family)